VAGRERLAGLRAAGCCMALAVVFPAAHVPGPSQVRSAVNMVAARKAALARANAKVTALAKVLTALETRAETLTERYDQAMWSEKQASAAYDVAAARLAAARRTQRADAGKIAASQADSAVAGVFAGQAAGLLAQRRADLAAAASLKKAVQSAVAAQLAAVTAAKAHRGQLKAQLASATRAEATLEAEASAAATPAPVVTEAGGGPGQSWSVGGAATADQGLTAVNWALTQIGKPYQWGGAGPSTYDCSGLAMDAWARAGIQLAHWTGYQWLSGPHVPISQLRPGDLVFFATNTADPATIRHVGIYVGQGMMVDAPYTGVDVRIDSIYLVGGLIGATRPAA
jgi:cell wall-associated NlpC family hydrolase